MSNKIDNTYISDIAKQKSWFKRSPKLVQNTIIDLPNVFDGFKSGLINIPEKSNGKYFWKIEFIHVGKNKLLVGLVFKAETNNEESLVEFVSTKEGDNPFSFGIIGMRVKGKITHIGIVRKQSFVSEVSIYQPIQAFFPNFSNQTSFSLPESLTKELKSALKTEIDISGFIDLGKVLPDPSMSWNKVSLFMATINVEDNMIQDRGTIKFIPVKEIKKYAESFSDGILLTIITKLSLLDVI